MHYLARQRCVQPLKSSIVSVENKRFFCDLRANDRGRFLKYSPPYDFHARTLFLRDTPSPRLAQMNKGMGGQSRSRVTVVIPTSGLRKLR